jgi:hypothetical protein
MRLLLLLLLLWLPQIIDLWPHLRRLLHQGKMFCAVVRWLQVVVALVGVVWLLMRRLQVLWVALHCSVLYWLLIPCRTRPQKRKQNKDS